MNLLTVASSLQLSAVQQVRVKERVVEQNLYLNKKWQEIVTEPVKSLTMIYF